MSIEIKRRAAAYDQAKRKGLRSNNADEALFWFHVAASTAWRYPFDRWSDPEIDEALITLASALGAGNERIHPDPSKLIHLTSHLGEGGGHVEAIRLWCEHVGGDVISSEWESSKQTLPKDLSGLHQRFYFCPPHLGPTQKVNWLFQQFRKLRPAKIVLHVNPNDVASLTASLMYRNASAAEISVYDHVDSFYWLGSTLVDHVIEFRPVGAVIARDLRGVAPSRISLAPLISRTRNSPEVTRNSLGIPSAATVSLTVAAYYKMTPDGHWDYARTINRLLDANPEHYHIIVGHGSPAAEKLLLKKLKRDRVLMLGKRTDIDALVRASDVIIESFPLMGGLFRLDTIREGKPIVAVVHPKWPEIFDTGVFPDGYPLVATSNEEVESFSESLIKSADLRDELGRCLKKHYERNFSVTAVRRSMEEALLGRLFEIPDWPLVYDAEWFSRMLNPNRCDSQGIINWVANCLSYAPPPNFSERFSYWKRYLTAALQNRLRVGSLG
jgi:glycosyltransferase involved in cell wall biosynthesis